MPSGTTYAPQKTADMIATQLKFNGQGVSTTIPAGTTANLDYVLADDCCINGAKIITNNGNYGDKANFQVLDTATGTYTLAATGTAVPYAVLSQFLTNWYFSPTTNEKMDLVYPAKILTGMTIRVKYTSTGVNDVFFAINYKLHKVLT